MSKADRSLQEFSRRDRQPVAETDLFLLNVAEPPPKAACHVGGNMRGTLKLWIAWALWIVFYMLVCTLIALALKQK